jgi:hypothetical protein
MAMICTVCGAENMEGSIYCEDCGARLPVSGGGGAAPLAPPMAATPPAPVAPPPTPTFTPAAPAVEAAEPTRDAMPAVGAGAGAGAGAGVCGTCGAVNGPGEKYCEDCGAALDDSASGSAMPTPQIGASPPPISPPPTPAVPTTPAQAVAQAVAGKPRLEAITSGQTFVLSKDENAVGRRSPVDGIFPEVDLTEADVDSYISRRHGKIIMGEQGPVYEDLGSSNGSFHNGTRLQQGVQAVLREGDRLRLGKTELVFHSN